MNAPQPNHAKLAEDLFRRFSLRAGFDVFVESVAILSMLSSTPGWHDTHGIPTQPGAKAIGQRQWGDAQLVAGLITEAVPGAPWPDPAIDTDDAGVIMLQWRISENAQLDLTLRSSLVRAKYEWTQMRDGIRSELHRSDDPHEVIASLQSVVRGAAKC